MHRIRASLRKRKSLMGLGTTLTAAVVRGAQAFWAHAGDSRLYHAGRDDLVQVSRDHRFVQELIDSGELTRQEASRHPLRNYLDQCLGSPPGCGPTAAS